MRNTTSFSNRASRRPSNTLCFVESLEGRLCMTASITVDPFQYEFSVFEHETIGFANKTGGPILAEIHCKDIPQDPEQFQVSLAWSDGTFTRGGVASYQIEPGDPLIWYITLGDVKTMGDPGNYSVTATINQVGHPEVNASTIDQYQVNEYRLFAHAQVVYATTATPHHLDNVTVATFDDGWIQGDHDTTETPAHFNASIDWGDGSLTAGTIIADPQVKGRYSVIASHDYAGFTAKTYPTTVHISEKNSNNRVTVYATATVYAVPIVKPINLLTAPLNPFSTIPVDKVWDN